jgi:methylated-DNA-protein-cysteine methyltransferase-like protein
MNTLVYPNRDGPCFYFKERKMPKKTNKAASTQRPLRVNPSGKREESFFELVYEVARQIPRGRVTSYGAIAACLGTKMSARMVGWAMNGAHHSRFKVPAHRVVNRNGMLSGKHHFGHPDAMQRLLEKENIKVVDDQVQDFKRIFWDPATELI